MQNSVDPIAGVPAEQAQAISAGMLLADKTFCRSNTYETQMKSHYMTAKSDYGVLRRKKESALPTFF